MNRTFRETEYNYDATTLMLDALIKAKPYLDSTSCSSFLNMREARLTQKEYNLKIIRYGLIIAELEDIE